jgi:hypothetical protein
MDSTDICGRYAVDTYQMDVVQPSARDRCTRCSAGQHKVGSDINRAFPLKGGRRCCNVLTGCCLAIANGYRSDGGVNDVTASDGYVNRYIIWRKLLYVHSLYENVILRCLSVRPCVIKQILQRFLPTNSPEQLTAVMSRCPRDPLLLRLRYAGIFQTLRRNGKAD